jgi:hypothetical protein
MTTERHSLEKQWVFFFDDENILYYGINTKNYILSEEFL